MTQKESLEEAQAHVEQLEKSNVDLTQQIVDLNFAIGALQNDKAELQAKISEIISERETSVAALNEVNKAITEKNANLEAEAKTAEARAREISARMQVNLPDKPAQPGEGIPNAISELKGFDKTRAYFESRQPQPANP